MREGVFDLQLSMLHEADRATSQDAVSFVVIVMRLLHKPPLTFTLSKLQVK